MAKKKPNKIMLTLEEDFDFEIFGICSHHPDYRLAFEINQKLNLRLFKSDHDFIPDLKKGTPGAFSCFEHIDEDFGAFYLIKNSAIGKHLIPEKSMIDYFLFVNQLNGIEIQKTVKILNDIGIVLATYHFDSSHLPSISSIHLDF
ncbi:MAG: IPExxxVDY family protein [Bacteroidetes bacterium]|nr:IPExxxVDY family protein [Bacteroidota bacterium]